MRHFPTHSARGVVRVCLCVEHTVSCAKPAGRIEMLFAGRTLVVSVKHGCILATLSEYDRSFCARQRCFLVSN